MGCGRSKFHSKDNVENHSQTNGIEKETKSSVEPEVDGRNRTRRCTPSVNFNGSLQQNSLNVPEKFEKFSLNNKPMGNKAFAPQVLRVTNSQQEFFKMLDEKIEQGGILSSDEEDARSYYKQSIENIHRNSS